VDKNKEQFSPLKSVLYIIVSNEGLVKVHISLPNHWMIGGESLWAEPIGENTYRLENVPFFAYGLNFRDEVKALPDKDDILEIGEVIQRSGNKTIRIMFDKSLDKEGQQDYIDAIRALDCSVERWDKTMLAINIRKSADFNQVYDYLDSLCSKEILAFETCHQRVEGSFDDSVDDDV
jgi:hypothetical protein